MSEFGNAFDFPELEDSDLDIAAIFGDPVPAVAAPPPAAGAVDRPESTRDTAPAAEQAAQKKPDAAQNMEQEISDGEKANAAEDDKDSEPNLFAALTSNGEPAAKPAKTTQDAPKQVSLFDKPPIFSYGGAKEEIKDASITFEELRIAKSDDFPELGEGKKVSWSVTYGKVSKFISDPKGTTIASIKEEIEKSKAFLDALKKAAKEKDRSPDCLVTPKVTAQSKGIASYKGVFATVEDAQASDKAICLIPSRDGRIYELRKTEMGDFIAPKHKIVDFSAVRAGFTPALPLIPREVTGEVKDVFKFTYGGRYYNRLSLSEKIRAGLEVSELVKRLTGRNYPVFIDNMESVDELTNVRPTGQIIMAKCVRGAALTVKPMGRPQIQRAA